MSIRSTPIPSTRTRRTLVSKLTIFSLLLAGACSGGNGGGNSDHDGGGVAPSVSSTMPMPAATDVPLNGGVQAKFSIPMDAATITTSTFTLAVGATGVAVPGTVVYANSAATFWPSAHLVSNGTFVATITTGATSAAGVALPANHTWTFSTGTTNLPGQLVDLGGAADFAILAKAGVSTVPTSAVTGNVGVSPAAATYLTGFDLTADATNVFATSTQVTGKLYAATYASPTPTNLTTAVADMMFAFTDAAARAPDFTELGAGDVSGMTLAPGVYKWGTGLLLSTDVTLTGSADDVWIFQIAQGLTVANGVQVVLAGGALPSHVFWQVGGATTIGTTAELAGTVLCMTSITLGTGASVSGRLLAQTAVDIAASTVVAPAN